MIGAADDGAALLPVVSLGLVVAVGSVAVVEPEVPVVVVPVEFLLFQLAMALAFELMLTTRISDVPPWGYRIISSRQ